MALIIVGMAALVIVRKVIRGTCNQGGLEWLAIFSSGSVGSMTLSSKKWNADQIKLQSRKLHHHYYMHIRQSYTNQFIC